MLANEIHAHIKNGSVQYPRKTFMRGKWTKLPPISQPRITIVRTISKADSKTPTSVGYFSRQTCCLSSSGEMCMFRYVHNYLWKILKDQQKVRKWVNVIKDSPLSWRLNTKCSHLFSSTCSNAFSVREKTVGSIYQEGSQQREDLSRVNINLHRAMVIWW